MAGERPAVLTPPGGLPRPPAAARGPVAALAVLALAWLVVRASDVSLAALNTIHAEALRTYAVGVEHVEGWRSGEYNPFVGDRLTVLTVLLSPIWLVAVAALGRPLVLCLAGARAWPGPVVWIAAFLPGYLVVLAPLQLVMSALPIPSGPRVGFVAVVAWAALVNRRGLSARIRSRGERGRPARPALIAGALVASGLLLAFIHRLQAGRNFMVPDSGIALLDWAEAQRRGDGPGRYLPHWDQQADEWVFSAPVMFFHGARDFLLPLFLTQVVALASFAILVGALAYSFAPRRRRTVAVVVSAVILAASPVVDPRYYVSLWGGQTPTMWLGHPGREIALVAPWAVLLVLIRGVERRPPISLVLLAAAGLGFISIHAATFVTAAVVGVAVWRGLEGRAPGLGGRPVEAVILALGVLVVLAPLAVFSVVRRVDDPDSLALVLAGAAVTAIGAAAVLALRADPAASGTGLDRRAGAILVGWWFGALALGLLVSGNLTSRLPGVQGALGLLFPGYDQPVLSRGLVGSNPAGDLRFPVFTGQECSISAHCLGGGGYLAGYAMASLAALAGWFAMRRLPAGRRPGIRATWLVCAAAFCLAFVLVDFSGSILPVAWILTRFIEVPFYGLVAIGLLVLVSSASELTSRITVAVAAVWVVVPFAASATPDQWVTNVSYMLSAL